MKIMVKKISTVLVIALLLLVGVFYLGRTTTPAPKPGSVSGPDISSPYFSYGDVQHWAGRTTSLIQASTTVCAIQSPAATSTLEFASIRFTVSSTTASTVTLAKSATRYATTTLLVAGALAANAQGTVVASTTPTGGATVDGTNVFAPSQWFVVSMSGGTGTFSPTGICQAGWRPI